MAIFKFNPQSTYIEPNIFEVSGIGRVDDAFQGQGSEKGNAVRQPGFERRHEAGVIICELAGRITRGYRAVETDFQFT